MKLTEVEVTTLLQLLKVEIYQDEEMLTLLNGDDKVDMARHLEICKEIEEKLVNG